MLEPPSKIEEGPEFDSDLKRSIESSGNDQIKPLTILTASIKKEEMKQEIIKTETTTSLDLSNDDQETISVESDSDDEIEMRTFRENARFYVIWSSSYVNPDIFSMIPEGIQFLALGN